MCYIYRRSGNIDITIYDIGIVIEFHMMNICALYLHKKPSSNNDITLYDIGIVIEYHIMTMLLHLQKKPSGNNDITLYDIGIVIEKLMGGAYRASFCRKQFKVMYNAVMRKVRALSVRHGRGTQ